MKTSIIIPLYFDRIELYPIISRCLGSYKPKKDWELILVDDASPLCTDEWPVTYKSPVNLGYTGNVNKGVELSNGKELWIINDDIEFNDEVLEKMSRVMDEDTIYLPRWGQDSMEDTKFGFFYGMTKKTWDKLGGLDSNLRHYFSDLDMWARSKELGIRIVKWETIVTHVGGATYEGNQRLFSEDMERYRLKHGRVD